MKVQATKIGYYDHVRRREGDVFDIKDQPRRKPEKKEVQLDSCKAVMDKDGKVPEAFSSLWMVKALQGAERKTTGAQAAINKKVDALAGKPNTPDAGAGKSDDNNSDEGSNDKGGQGNGSDLSPL